MQIKTKADRSAISSNSKVRTLQFVEKHKKKLEDYNPIRKKNHVKTFKLKD